MCREVPKGLYGGVLLLVLTLSTLRLLVSTIQLCTTRKFPVAAIQACGANRVQRIVYREAARFDVLLTGDSCDALFRASFVAVTVCWS